MFRNVSFYLNSNFPELIKLIEFYLVLPMSSVEAERGFSVVFDVKSKKRNRMQMKLLSALIFIQQHSPKLEVDPKTNEDFLFRAHKRWREAKNRYKK